MENHDATGSLEKGRRKRTKGDMGVSIVMVLPPNGWFVIEKSR
jgi:hypothetical protein